MMKKNANEELAKHFKIKGGSQEEQAAALAVITTLIAQQHASTPKEQDSWSNYRGFRSALNGTWKSQITI